MLYVIKKENGLMLSGVGIGSHTNPYTWNTTTWTKSQSCAIHFNAEEAHATIDFITNVIDWELGEEIYYDQVE